MGGRPRARAAVQSTPVPGQSITPERTLGHNPPMPEFLFRPLRPDEEDLGYRVICSGLDLEYRERELDFGYPYERRIYAERHARGENFGLFRDGQLVACVSLGLRPALEWRWGFAGPFDNIPVAAQALNRLLRPRLRRPFLWLSTLVVGDVPSRSGLGRRAVEAAIQHANSAGAAWIYLQTSSRRDLLPRYYRSLGFTEARRKPRPGGLHWVLFEGDVARLAAVQTSGRSSLESNDQSEKSRYSPRASL